MITFLSPIAALASLAALLPLAAAAYGRRRVAEVQRMLGLQPARRPRALRLAAATAAVVLLGLAAAQPVLTHVSHARARRDVAALFVLDTSRSMAASATASAPTRLDRAVAAAVQLRRAIPEVPAGIATLTDRVLPDLLPVADANGFDGVAARAVGIESPPPLSTSVRATNYAALAGIASGNYFPPNATRRLVVLLTDGESVPFDQSAIAQALPESRGYRFVAIRFWRSDEAVFGPSGTAEAGYRPDPLGRVLLEQLAAATGGRLFEQDQVGGAAGELKALSGSGPTSVVAGVSRGRRALAPYVAALALIVLLLGLAPFAKSELSLESLA